MIKRHSFRLAYCPPYDWAHVIGFLAARATPGVERIDANTYQRTIADGDATGTIAIEPAEAECALTLDIELDAGPGALPSIVDRVRRMFDVDAKPAAIAQRLSADPLLRDAATRRPGLRRPGAWDAFEITVRAVLGQQISVKAATTIAGRLAERWGTSVTASGLSRLFPAPDQLADAPLEDAGLTRSRASTIRSLAAAVAGGAVTFDDRRSLDALRAIPGIGDWTAQYVAMRALHDPDAFPSGDLILRRMAGGCTAPELERRSEAWRPWRAYAVMLLWQEHSSGRTGKQANGQQFPRT